MILYVQPDHSVTKIICYANYANFCDIQSLFSIC